jgi:cysteine-rich repeat protein
LTYDRRPPSRRPEARLGLLVALVLTVTSAAPAQAHDIELPIDGKQLVLKAGKRHAKYNSFRFYAARQDELGPRHDPATAGFSIQIVGTGPQAGHSGLIDLDPALWRTVGNPASPKEYRYRDPDGTRGGITRVRLRSGKLRIVGKGENLPWLPAGAQDAVWVIVKFEAETYCAEFGGKVRRNEAGAFRALNAPAPDECLEPVCGNREVELGEACDDGNLNEVDGCTSACELGPCELAPDITSTFEAIQRVVFDSPTYGCTNAVCHGGATQGNLSLLSGQAYDNLVGVDAFGSTAERVLPGEPEQSYLYQLLAARTLGTPVPGGGTPMPTGGGSALSEKHLEAIAKWIRGGAPRDLVVAGTAELLGSCLPDADPLTIPVPPSPGAGFGVQFRQTPWSLPATSEDEICMSTYYDLTQTNLVPDYAKVPCPPALVNVNNPSGECFAWHRQALFQDPQSHHSIIHIYTGQFDTTHAGWGPWTRKFQDPSDPDAGAPCDPHAVDPVTGYSPDCSGAVKSGIACIGYGPPDLSQGTGVGGIGGGTAPMFSGSQEPFFELDQAPGVYAVLPMSGVIVWNSHAFNLTNGDSTMSQYLNMFFAGRGDQLFPAQQIFDDTSIFVQNVPPFQSREYCRTYTIPLHARLFQLASHTHRHGKLWRTWAPPNTPCTPGQAACVPRTDREPIYFSTQYTDPVQLMLDPPVAHDDPDPASRTYLYCSLYDNGEELNSRGEMVHPVKLQSTSPEPPLVFGLPLGPGGPCPDAPGNPANGVACLAGPLKGQPCFGVDSMCDSTPGAGDGRCDACRLRGGVTTEDEMFILLGNYYIDDGSTAGTEITPANVSALSTKWEFPLTRGVTSSPVVSGGLVYVTSWDGKVYALNKEDGQQVWSFDTGSAGILGVQATVTVAPGGQVVVGDSKATIYLLDGQTGAVVWQKSIGNPAVDHIWGAATVSAGRVFIGIASHSDNPCTNGRLVALDFATGDVLWARQNVPDKICTTDTAVACTTDAECGAGGTCVAGQGAGVTGQPMLDPTGSFVYTNSVGCYTFPSIGDSDSVMKLDAATGATIWLTRVQPPEQFGACMADPSIDCGTDAVCGGTSGSCKKKAFYHDFGFLNGPHLVDVDDGLGGTKTLVVSASKDGTLYAFDATDGSIAWTNEVLPTPVTPAFAGFGLFNGQIALENGRIFAALNEFAPPVSPAPDHLMAFDVNDGHVVWSDDIGPSWGHVGISNGVLFTGANGKLEFYAYDADTGARLATFPLPAATSSKATVDGTSLYIGYGIFGTTGGVRAYILP